MSCAFIFVALSLALACNAVAADELENSITTMNSAVNAFAVHEVWEGGTNYPTSGASYTFTGLDTSLYSYTLTVEVYATDYASSNEYVDRISAGSTTLTSFCNPGVDVGGYYYTCVSGQDVTGDVSGGSLTVLTTATSQINCCSYNGYYLYVQYTLSTDVSPHLWEGGTNSPTSGASYTFTGLDTSLYSYTLTVDVYATDYASSDEYVDRISAGSTILSSNCNPGVDSGGYYYNCVSDQDVTGDVSGGSLSVLTTATSQINCCAYNGHYLYVQYSLNVVWEGGTNSPTSGLSFSFTGLGSYLHGYSLTAEVYATDYASSSEYVDNISAGSTTLSSLCNPGVDGGAYFYTCLSGQDVTGDVSGGSLAVAATATSLVDINPYNGYYFYMKFTLKPGTLMLVPTSLPTSQPTATVSVWEGGTNSPTSGASYTFTGLDTSLYSYTLTVEVYATDYASSDEYVDGIYAGSTTLSSNCNPGVDVGGYYYTCVSGRDVTGDVSGGSLTVLTTATSQINCCAYNGYYLYVQYTLSRTHNAPVVWEGGTNYPTSGLFNTFSGLDTSVYTYTLTAEVYANDYSSSSEYVSYIYSGSTTLSSFCDPGFDGSSFYTCVSGQDVTADVSGGSLSLSAYATSSVDQNPYNGYSFYMRYSLTATSIQNTPTLVWEGGSNSPTSGVSHTFTGLDTSLYSYSLMVEVYATDFSSSSEYVDDISAGYTTLTSYCDPGVDNGYYYYTCVGGQDVTGYVSGGSLAVSATATSSVDSNPYLGYDFYVKFSLVRTTSSSMVLEGGTNYPTSGVFLTFTGLDTSSYDYALTVEVYATDFSSSSEYVSDIYAGYYSLYTTCDPGVDNGQYFHTCIYQEPVTDKISSGDLVVGTVATSYVDSNPYQGYTFYVRYSLESTLKQDDDDGGSDVGAIIGSVVGVLCCCGLIVGIVGLCTRKNREKEYKNATPGAGVGAGAGAGGGIQITMSPSGGQMVGGQGMDSSNRGVMQMVGGQGMDSSNRGVVDGTLVAGAYTVMPQEQSSHGGPAPPTYASTKEGVVPGPPPQRYEEEEPPPQYGYPPGVQLAQAQPISVQQPVPTAGVVSVNTSGFVPLTGQQHMPQLDDDEMSHYSQHTQFTVASAPPPPPPRYEDTL